MVLLIETIYLEILQKAKVCLIDTSEEKIQ